MRDAVASAPSLASENEATKGTGDRLFMLLHILKFTPGINGLLSFSNPIVSYKVASFIGDVFILTFNAMVAYLILKAINAYERLDPKYYSASLFILGILTLLLYIIFNKIWFYAPGINVKTKYLSNIHYAKIYAEIILYIAMSKVFIGMKAPTQK